MRTIRVLIADDHTIVREGIRHVLDQEPGIEVAAEAEDGREAIRLATAMPLDVIFMDISMPGLNGIDAARQILKSHPHLKIIILSMHSDKRFVERALKSGVSGYLLKNRAVAEVTTAIQSVVQGKMYLSPGITHLVVEDYIRHVPENEEPGRHGLTAREREVLQLIAEGLSTKAIAAAMNLSEKTIEGHRQKIMDKLNLHSIAQLTKFAIREGLTTLDD
ncbi:MAG TPA: response regulator transcription factor [bacterium]|nr:response regulator transcription factor [bacterium]HOL94675.1 response regulator transcription factor [bacterium]HPO99812.1 response regulator transcription factor [bacterium]